MGKKEECVSILDVEEGEISDSGSVEEITEKDFAKKDFNNKIKKDKEEATAAAAAAAAATTTTTTTTTTTNNHHNNKEEAKASSDPMLHRGVWTMQDLYKYRKQYHMSGSGSYASGLYNLAWAQAVQNKPLDEYLLMEFKNSDNHNHITTTSTDPAATDLSSSNNAHDDDDNFNNKVVLIELDDDTPIELEEGEIDLDSSSHNNDPADIIMPATTNNHSDPINSIDLLNSICQELDSVKLTDVNKSLDQVCSRMQKLLESLEVLSSQNLVSKDASSLADKSFAAIQSLYSVFRSMSQNQMTKNRVSVLRLLACITSKNPPVFSSEKMKEVEVMIKFLGSFDILSNSKDVMEEEVQITKGVNNNHSDLSAHFDDENVSSVEKCVLDSVSIESSEQNCPNVMLEALKTGVASYKGRGALLPLLDPHKDHDADSLPSPTRDTPPILPIEKTLAFEDVALIPECSIPRQALGTHSTGVQSYETDAFKAVSTYQQKFGRNSFLMINRLPSPTPSEGSDDIDTDTGGEVSSYSTRENVNPISAPNLSRSTVSSLPHINNSSEQGLINSRNAATPLSSGSTAVRSRDPRIRFANFNASASAPNQHILPLSNNEPKVVTPGEMISSRKQKIVQEPILDGPALKRQRNLFSDVRASRDVESVSGFGGRLEDRGTVGLNVTSKDCLVDNQEIQPKKFENNVTNEMEHLPVAGGYATTSLNTLLKDIAVNPAMWMNIFKMEQQKIIEPLEIINRTQSSTVSLGAVPVINIQPSKPPSLEQKSVGVLQTPQASSDEAGKLRMKPRDPRRALQSNSSHKVGNFGSDQSRTISLSTQGVGSLNVQKQEDQLGKKTMPSQSTSSPDIARQFTKNLKCLADIMSDTQVSMTPTTVPPIPSSQTAQIHPSWVDVKRELTESGSLQSEAGLASGGVSAGPSKAQNSWGDVEHLFEGFDDQEKADIQKERTRRIEEQKKMFVARKLCLVLDLDHTLLNSAKFAEVDPMHDELLRKKEEQDREKPHRHLFRFTHMGMWTKLRPGIWNFLEKASKLFEMHLYTMGNKLYATEMAKLLDPKGVLFAGRVISKGYDGDLIDGDDRVPKTKDLEGVLGMESGVVIIDDSLRVWPHNKLNLIVVERYIYFPCSRRQFGLPGPSLLEIDHDERSENGTLASSLGVIERIHQQFFTHPSLEQADVRNILAEHQRKILGGCRIVFSRVFPVGEANPQLHPLWQTAEQFGAVCTNQIYEQVTHVVANSLGTDKVNWALSTGKFVVHPGWVEASALLYRRANEHDFAVKS